MRVRSIVTEPLLELPRRSLALLARRVVAGEGQPLNLQIIFTGDAVLRDLNHRYRHKDRTTDVLSFHIPGVPGLEPEGGEIYISLPQAQRQARRYRHSLEAELKRLVVHGTLHLLGFDHQRTSEARLMQAREKHYLRRHE
jgi:probable rRNA maturation factor